MDPGLFRQFAERKLTLEMYRTKRFEDVLTAVGGPRHLVAEMNAVYMRIANEEVALFDDALPALDDLESRGIELVLLTNGPADGQRSKLSRLGIEERFSRIFISQEIGMAVVATLHAFASSA